MRENYFNIFCDLQKEKKNNKKINVKEINLKHTLMYYS